MATRFLWKTRLLPVSGSPTTMAAADAAELLCLAACPRSPRPRRAIEEVRRNPPAPALPLSSPTCSVSGLLIPSAAGDWLLPLPVSSCRAWARQGEGLSGASRLLAGAPVLIVGGGRTLNLLFSCAERVRHLSLVGGVKQPWGRHSLQHFQD